MESVILLGQTWLLWIVVDITEILKRQGDEGVPDLVHVMRTLASESIPNLPPGGELASKWVPHNLAFSLYFKFQNLVICSSNILWTIGG